MMATGAHGITRKGSCAENPEQDGAAFAAAREPHPPGSYTTILLYALYARLLSSLLTPHSSLLTPHSSRLTPHPPTVSLETTCFTPLTLRAISTARCATAWLGTLPYSVTTPR